MTGQGTERIFGVEPAAVTAAAHRLTGHAEELTQAAGALGGAVAEARDLPGGRLCTALRDGAAQVGTALDGEAAAVDVCAGDLHSFVAAVTGAEAASAASLAGGGRSGSSGSGSTGD
ncbi:hypothetical protein [Corynebacterium nuruki]|jgi:hypothetical protein|uniref:hypothetical protein n=1 Tax=Corynebacterium nuruki TaxID=1032851 RepID=UPI00265791AF|nr:hypothetical protein [Corynebacterium nuruki]